MFCLERAGSLESDDPACHRKSLSHASNGAVTDSMTDSQPNEPSIITPECAVNALSLKMPQSRAEHRRQQREPLAWPSPVQRGSRFQIPEDSLTGATRKHTMTLVAPTPFVSLENQSHKVDSEIHCFPRLTTAEMNHLLNQQTALTMAKRASTAAQASYSHACIHQHDHTSFTQKTTSSKSKSIKIKRGRGSDDFASASVSASAEQMYDWATWRMYHRITSARRNRSAVVPVTDMSDPSIYSTTYHGFDGFPQEASEDFTVHGGLANTVEDSDEGVFVMDL